MREKREKERRRDSSRSTSLTRPIGDRERERYLALRREREWRPSNDKRRSNLQVSNDIGSTRRTRREIEEEGREGEREEREIDR